MKKAWIQSIFFADLVQILVGPVNFLVAYLKLIVG